MVDPKKANPPPNLPTKEQVDEERKRAAGKSPVVDAPVRQYDTDAELLSADDIKGMVGDVEPGNIGYVKLDEKGKPIGPARWEHPKGDEIVAPVLGQAPVTYDELTTPSGAPLTTRMNPEHRFTDAGLDSRLKGYETGKQPEQAPVYRTVPVSRTTGEVLPPKSAT